MEIAQEEKAARLQHAVINSSVEELSKLYDELGYVEMTAPALGLACRFRGLAMVKALVERGAVFDFPSTDETEAKYGCYIGQKYENYRTNYSLYLLSAFRGGLKGACCTKGMKFAQNAKRDTGKPLPFLGDEERVNVLDYLLANQEKISFQPEEMLFYAIYARDTVLYETMKKHGITLSGRRVQALTKGGMATDGYWYEYGAMTKKLADEDYLGVMERLAAELQGKPFYYTDKMYDITSSRFVDIRIFEYFLSHFRQEKMKKYQIIRGLIDQDALDALPVIERAGWLGTPKKRDEMIEYASGNKKTEALAWLLDYKNRTADFAAEQEKEEKKLMRGLNSTMSPDSVAALKKIWSYKKQEDGTLVITSYKGTDLEVTVPEKIGKSIVTAIGKGAFIASGGRIFITVYATPEQQRHRRQIQKITLPGTIRHIGVGAFGEMAALREINIPDGVEKIEKQAFFACASLQAVSIPDGVEEIGEQAFFECGSLKEITVPGSVRCVGGMAFARCDQLEKACLCEGVEEIGERVFYNCGHLREVHIPQSVQCLRTATDRYGYGGYEVFSDCPDVTVYCPDKSAAAAYCREKGFRFENSAGYRRL